MRFAISMQNEIEFFDEGFLTAEAVTLLTQVMRGKTMKVLNPSDAEYAMFDKQLAHLGFVRHAHYADAAFTQLLEVHLKGPIK